MIELYCRYLRVLNWLLQTMVGIIVVSMTFIVPTIVILLLIFLLIWFCQ